MDTKKIQQALQAASETEAFILGAGCRYETPQIFQKYFPAMAAVVVADEITFEVVGKLVQEQLQTAHVDTIDPFVFPGKPILHADYVHIERLREFLKD